MRGTRIAAMVALILILAACGGGAAAPASSAADATSEGQSAKGSVHGGTLERIRETGQLRVGWATLAGYAAVNPSTDQVEGLYIDVMLDIAEDMGVELVLVEDAWNTLVLGMQSDKFDATILGITDARQEQVDFGIPLLVSDFTFVVKKGAPFQSVEELDQAGNTISVTQGSNTDELLTKVIKNAEILRLRDVGTAILAVRNGDADAMAAVRDYALASIENEPELEVVDFRFGESIQSIAGLKGDSQFINYMNDQIQRVLAEGVVQQAIDRHGLVGVEVPESGS